MRRRLLVAIWLFMASTACAQLEVRTDQLELHFIDVGQGDAVFMRFPSGNTVLYDGGRNATTVASYLAGLGVTQLDVVIASHADADHIGGLAEVIERFNPTYFVDNGIPGTTQTYENLLYTLLASDTQTIDPSTTSARRINLGDASINILPIPGITSWDQNDNSVGIIVTYGAFNAAFLGDSGPRQQGWWLTNHRNLLPNVDVYKASHHGSQNGDGIDMMNALDPEIVVISVSATNSYGHPSQQALSLYALAGAQVYRTDTQGTITVNTNNLATVQATVARTSSPAVAPRITPPPQTPARTCCRVCRTGKACGDSCINRSYTCSRPAGCACNASFDTDDSLITVDQRFFTPITLTVSDAGDNPNTQACIDESLYLEVAVR